MNLRELIVERIMFCADEDELLGDFEVELNSLSDLDLLELYEEVMVEPV